LTVESSHEFTWGFKFHHILYSTDCLNELCYIFWQWLHVLTLVLHTLYGLWPAHPESCNWHVPEVRHAKTIVFSDSDPLLGQNNIVYCDTLYMEPFVLLRWVITALERVVKDYPVYLFIFKFDTWGWSRILGNRECPTLFIKIPDQFQRCFPYSKSLRPISILQIRGRGMDGAPLDPRLGINRFSGWYM
jgi:hypothetical protein